MALHRSAVGIVAPNRIDKVNTVSRELFTLDPIRSAQELLGCTLVWGKAAGKIVETEAYAEFGDEASHAFLRTGVREFIRFRPPGSIYVYLNYGVHWLLNFLVKQGPWNGFVLIRALEPVHGIDLMEQRRGLHDPKQLCSGPGKLTQALGITGESNGADFFNLPDVCLLARTGRIEVAIDRRIGITKSPDLPWRFVAAESKFLSAPVRKTRPRAN